MNENEKIRGSVVIDIFSGLGLGLLLGVVVGLSSSPVVAIVVGSLTSLLAVFLGLEGGDDSKARMIARIRLNGLRIGSFGLATVLALIFGLYVRINNPLAKSPAEQLEKWHAVFPVTVSDGKPEAGANYADSPEQARDNRILARQMMIYERTGLVPAKLRFGKDSSSGKSKKDSGSDGSGDVTVAESKHAGTRTSVLFSSTRKGYDLCRELDRDKAKGRAPQTEEETLRKWLKRFDRRGLKNLVTMLNESPATTEEKLRLLDAARASVCDVRELTLQKAKETSND